MRPIRSLLVSAAIVLSFQSSVFADAVIHKESLSTAQSILDETIKINNRGIHYPKYHFALPANLIGIPTGLVYFQGQYHIFYEQNPIDTNYSILYTGHSVSPDLINWIKKPLALAPSEDYDKDNILTANAIVDDDLLYLVYTGQSENTNDNEKQIKQTQNLAMSKDGNNFGKSANNPIIKIAPHYAGMFFSSEKFRSPFIWKHNNKYYALIGTQFKKTKDGAVVLYKSDDLRNWIFVNVTAIGSNGEMGDMWESPQLISIDGNDILVISPHGIKPKNKEFLNKYNTGWFIGKLDYNTGKFKQNGPFGLFDYGFDFYSPKIIKSTDGKNVLIASLNQPDGNMPEKESKWAGIMSIPREIEIKNDKIITKPLKSLEQLRTEPIYYKNQKIINTKEFPQIFGDCFEMDIQADIHNAKIFTIKLRASETQETILLYDKSTQTLKLNRDKSSNTDFNIKGEREVKLPIENNILKLRIFVDKSSIEIFTNDGIAMSSRIYPDEESIDIIFSSEGETKINYLNFYKIKSINE